ncbi:MAG: RNA polymerase sigma factor [Spirochaetia bacterium]|nr:RNA polymerase sigma factor [Spirochaetia bacterium]
MDEIKSAASDESILIARALKGEASAIESLVRKCQDQVYNLALRFLWHPEDAEDATQEIMIRAITRLSTFRGESAFTTWVYRIAANHLINMKKSRMERREVSFESVGRELASVQPDFTAEFQNAELAGQVKVACTHAMLMCLDRDARIAFTLGVVFETTSEDAATILGITREAYRKRLSRARETMQDFLGQNCGLMNTKAPCQCRFGVKPCMENKSIEPYVNLIASLKLEGQFALRQEQFSEEIADTERLAAIYRDRAEFPAPPAILRRIQSLLISGPVFQN